MPIRTVIFDTKTGDPQLPIEPSAASWSAKIDGTGSGDLTLPIRGVGLSRPIVRSLLLPNARTVAHIADNDTVVAAGFITDTEYDRDKGHVNVNWIDIRGLFRQRMAFGVLSWGPSGTVTVTGKTHQSAVREVLRRGLGGGDSPAWELPITLPPDTGAGPFTKVWKYWDFPLIDDMLQEIEAEGYEVFFDPELENGKLVWRARVATRVINPFEWVLPVTTPESRVTNMRVKIDGSKQVTGVIYAGNGTEADTVVAGAGHGPYDIPVRDAFRSAKDVKSTAQLQRIANADLEEHFTPIVQRSFDVQLAAPVTAKWVKPGTRLILSTHGDEWLVESEFTQRVISVSGNLTSKVHVEVQNYGG